MDEDVELLNGSFFQYFHFVYEINFRAPYRIVHTVNNECVFDSGAEDVQTLSYGNVSYPLVST